MMYDGHDGWNIHFHTLVISCAVDVICRSDSSTYYKVFIVIAIIESDDDEQQRLRY